MLAVLRPALVMLSAFTVLTGLAYPLLVSGVVQLVLPTSANGSLMRKGDLIVGSALIGQSFVSDRYVQGRPSAAGEKGYDAAASSGSNLGPLSAKLHDRIKADVDRIRAGGSALLPADAATASASGLDPHISPAYAALQIGRIAAARGAPEAKVKGIIDRHIEQPTLGFIGEPRINVLAVNLALDAELPGRPQ